MSNEERLPDPRPLPDEDRLQGLRARIDEVDTEILQMITTRAELAKAVAAAKGGEVDLRIHHHLLGRERASQGFRASTAMSRRLPSALARTLRCRVASNAEAARRAAAEPGAAAIAEEAAAAIYGLTRIANNIEDESDNTTRFLIIGHRSTPPSGDHKTTLIFSAPNRPGVLYAMSPPSPNTGSA